MTTHGPPRCQYDARRIQISPAEIVVPQVAEESWIDTTVELMTLARIIELPAEMLLKKQWQSDSKEACRELKCTNQYGYL